MKDDLVDIFESPTLMEAKLLSDRLEAAGIRCFIDHTDSPLDGLVAADQMKIVRVLPNAADEARTIVAEFTREQDS